MAELTFKTHPHQVKVNAKAKILFDVWYFTLYVFHLFFDFFAFTIAFARVNGSLLWNLKNSKQRQKYAWFFKYISIVYQRAYREWFNPSPKQLS